MNNAPIIESIKALNNTSVTTQTTPDSIRPTDVGGVTNFLLDSLLPILNQINAFNISGGSANPSGGNDGDIYIQDGLQLVFWKNVDGVWVSKYSVNLGINIVDGNINVQSSVNGIVVTSSAGQWGIDNVIYQTATQTQFTVPTQDANFGRIDAVFANKSNTLTYVAGTASSNPDNTKPATPNDQVIITYIIVPSLASGNLPYISDSNTPPAPAPSNPTITANQTSLLSDGAEGYYLPITLPEGNVIANYAIINKGGTISYVPIQLTADGLAVVGFTDNQTQTITIKLI